jgi:hypothetical protein
LSTRESAKRRGVNTFRSAYVEQKVVFDGKPSERVHLEDSMRVIDPVGVHRWDRAGVHDDLTAADIKRLAGSRPRLLPGRPFDPGIAQISPEAHALKLVVRLA